MSPDRAQHISPFAKVWLDLFQQAYKHNVSDIHIEPLQVGMRVRWRQNGSLVEVSNPMFLVPEQATWLLKEVRQLFGFDAGYVGKIQDKRLSLPEIGLEFRASLIPVFPGSVLREKICLRLLELGKKFSFERLTLPGDAKVELSKALSQGSGLIVLSGPTGSGKTTTLYSAVSYLNDETRNISTLEDPKEYTVPGINQTQISPQLSFADGLKALMRQDPDVILVGEVRDEETASAVLRAATTGHLVLTTLHARHSLDVIGKLEELKLSPALVKETLTLACAQRLVALNCPHCRQNDPAGSALLRAAFSNATISSLKCKGCEACGHTGLSGRHLLFEYARLNPTTQSFECPSSMRTQLQDLTIKGEVNAEEAMAAL